MFSSPILSQNRSLIGLSRTDLSRLSPTRASSYEYLEYQVSPYKGGGRSYFVGHQPKKVRLVDVTGDNINDLIVLTAGSNWVSVMKGKSN
jgi:hypothetical protein